MAIRCVLDFGQPAIQRRDEYVQLESSEKINLSYWIGMTFAAIAAHEVLSVRRLTHAQRQSGLKKVNQKSKSLADLVGRDTKKRWHVIEAKGRQTPPDVPDRQDWKTQARTVRSINGTNVSTRSYCVGLIGVPCEIELVDPPSKMPNSQELKIDEYELGDGYYKPYREFVGRQHQLVKRAGRSFLVRVIAHDPISGDYIYVGLEESFMVSGQQDIVDVEEFEDQLFYAGTDGIVIAAGKNPCKL